MKFGDWGYPAWFRFVVGSGELLSAALLFVPRTRFVGVAILVVILTGAVITHIATQTRSARASRHPCSLALVVTVAVAWVTRRGWPPFVAVRQSRDPANVLGLIQQPGANDTSAPLEVRSHPI